MAEVVKLRGKGGLEATTAELLFDFENFLQLKTGKFIWSPVYTVGKEEQMTEWRLQVYPNGDTKENKGNVSVYLALHKSLKSEEVLVKYSIYLQSVLNQSTGKLNLKNGTIRQFNQVELWGWEEFISTSEIMKPEYCQNGTVNFGCDLTVYHEIKIEQKIRDWQPPKLNLLKSLWEQYQQKELTDATLEVGDDVIKCHKTVLSAGSAMFKKMFTNKDMLESQTGIVKVPNFGLEIIEKLVEFLYRSEISNFRDVNVTMISDLLVAADFYLVPELVSLCEYHLSKNLSAENVQFVLCFATKSQNSVLLERGVEFLIKNPELMKTEEFNQLLESNPKLRQAINADLIK